MANESKPASSVKNPTGGWRTFKPETDYEKCVGCGLCAKVCPEYAIAMETDKSEIGRRKNRKQRPITDYNFCKGCGVCAAECPVKAISMVLDKK